MPENRFGFMRTVWHRISVSRLCVIIIYAVHETERDYKVVVILLLCYRYYYYFVQLKMYNNVLYFA